MPPPEYRRCTVVRLEPFSSLLSLPCSTWMEYYRVLKWHYGSLEVDDRGIHETQGYACEIIAWRFLAHLSQHDLIDYLLYELPRPTVRDDQSTDGEDESLEESRSNEYRQLVGSPSSPLWERSTVDFQNLVYPAKNSRTRANASAEPPDPTLQFVGLNALEIAAVAGAKRFLSQRVVQKVVNGIWRGDIVFWTSLNTETTKKAQSYNKRYVRTFPPSFPHDLMTYPAGATSRYGVYS